MYTINDLLAVFRFFPGFSLAGGIRGTPGVDNLRLECYNFVMMKNLPLSIQTFRDIITQGYLYIDKTKEIYNLYARGGKYYFFSRPRRFGKSLLISTLKEIFSGNKELFKGLWIYDKIEDTTYPVIHIDFLGLKYRSEKELEDSLEYLIDQNAAAHGIELQQKGYDKRFRELIMEAFKKNPVVILVDEYDKPVIDFIETDSKDIARANQKVLKTFYSIIKSMDQYTRFIFITGVSKFSKVSVFSDLNTLIDITLYDDFSTLLGYTEEELKHYFSPYLKRTTEKMGMSEASLLKSIRKWYNGYSWDGNNFVYNPFSILSFFNANSFGNFWFSTGTPTFLIKLIKSQQVEIMEFENLLANHITFDCFDIDNMDVTSLLFQTGYMTIKKVTIENHEKTYELTYPNHEVRSSFLTHLLGMYTQKKSAFQLRLLKNIGQAVETGDLDRLIKEIKSLFASIPYHIFIGEREAYYHSIIYLVLSLSGIDVRTEEPTNTGRIDAVLEVGNKIYILEFKMGSESEALAQIKEMKYYEKYLGKGKEIVLVGIGFDQEKRNIGNYLMESL